jgi:hypothetical protein
MKDKLIKTGILKASLCERNRSVRMHRNLKRRLNGDWGRDMLSCGIFEMPQYVRILICREDYNKKYRLIGRQERI